MLRLIRSGLIQRLPEINMTKVTVTKTGNIDDCVNDLIRKIENVVDVAVTETVDEASVLMKQMIASRGTDKQWSTYYQGRSGRWRNHSGVGRIDSGAMYDAVGSQMIIDTRNRFTGEFGWVNGDPNGYYVLQENGFYNNYASIWVEPMNALRDSFSNSIFVIRTKITTGIKSI